MAVFLRFLRDERGNVAVIFTAFFLLMLFFSAGIYEIAHYLMAQSQLQHAVNAAAVSAASAQTGSVQQFGEAYVQANVSPDLMTLTGVNVTGGDPVRVQASATMKPDFLGLNLLAGDWSLSAQTEVSREFRRGL